MNLKIDQQKRNIIANQLIGNFILQAMCTKKNMLYLSILR